MPKAFQLWEQFSYTGQQWVCGSSEAEKGSSGFKYLQTTQ